ncbi:CheY-like chemotaxis protein [Allocatelliglobosispora scoriae]|uniref:CheY-like chemotaxis protein n=1 Tax=Allocatelliglobosispora scoriae TaxID=643052 RepID=A0A841BKE4_9ACTN|nr:hypothetical protein [Allocatelliglobosispora scoriae]MBB5867351.1 CheY-like chemotaxis protein [Allocatelliglobosispora scoriae]
MRILLVEDDYGDAALVEDALSSAGIADILHHADSGQEGLAYLRRDGAHPGARRPDLILLDSSSCLEQRRA